MIAEPASGMPGERSQISTPDRRVRVFVSSTLKELAAERATARAAITGLHLTPVMFELGARPHPARELYRAYLAQSEVFVGIYWQQYGWVAPGEETSGLEDEYLLGGDKPKLIYVKKAAGRDARLTGLLARVKADDGVSYKHFENAASSTARPARPAASQSRPSSSRCSARTSPATAPAPAGTCSVPHAAGR